MDTDLLFKIIQLFRITLTNIRIYPPSSTLVEDPFNDLYNSLNEYFKNNPVLTLSEMNNNILINGEQFVSKDIKTLTHLNELSKIIKQKELNSITFKSGLTKDELKTFLEGLVLKKPNLKTKDFLEQIFSEKKFNHITIDEIEYIPAVKSDQQISKIFTCLNQSANNMTDVMSTLGEVYTLMDSIKEPSLYDKIQERIANYIANLDIGLLKDVIQNQLPPKIENSGLKDVVISSFTKEKLEEIFKEIVNWCKTLKEKVSSETEYLNQLNSLKNFLKKLLQSPISKLISIEVYDQLLNAGVLDEVPQWLEETKKQQQSILFQLDTLLEKDSINLLESSVLLNLPEAVEKLCQLGLYDTLKKLVTKMIENFDNNLVDVRKITADTVYEFFKIMMKYRQDKIISQGSDIFLNKFEKEKEFNVYKIQNNVLSELCEYFISINNYEQAKNIIQLFKKISLQEFPSDAEKIKLVKQSIVNILDKTKDVFLTDLISLDVNKQALATWFILTRGEESVSYLINLIKQTDDIRSRIIIANVSKAFGEKTITEIKNNLNLGIPAKQLKNIIDILHVYGEKYFQDFIPILEKIVIYVSYPVKYSIIRYLEKFLNIKSAKTLLIHLLHNPDNSIKQEIINIIYENKVIEASNELLNLLPNVDNDIKKEICTVLGKLKVKEAIPVLTKIAVSSPKLFGIFPGIDPDVRARACWALSNFLEFKNVKDTIKNLTKDKNLSIKNFAKEILTNPNV